MRVHKHIENISRAGRKSGQSTVRRIILESLTLAVNKGASYDANHAKFVEDRINGIALMSQSVEEAKEKVQALALYIHSCRGTGIEPC